MRVTALATLAVALLAGAVSAGLERSAAGVSLGAPRVWLVTLAFGAAASAVVIVAAAVPGRATRPWIAHGSVGLVVAALFVWQAVDGKYFEIFRRHVDESAVRLGLDAVRSKTLHLEAGEVALGVALFLLVALALAVVHARLSRIAVSSDLEARLGAVSGIVVAAGLAAGLFRDRLSDGRHPAAAELSARLPWARNEEARAPRGEEDRSAVADIRAAAELGSLRAKIASAALSAKERPDLLVVHVESLRGDALTSTLMPRLSALGAECWTARRHYSTGNNTGMSVFGLVTGLGGFFYAGARRDPGAALPLVVLKKLGYQSSVHFANNLSHYDKIFDVVFGGAVGQPYTAPEGPSDRMDVAVVEHYLGSLDAGPSPRFDYVVLDSTHYDYAYPPEYERHTPSGTLGLSVRDAIIEEPGINERLSPRGPIIKNRYLNAVEWADSLIGRLVDGLRAHGRWGKTWVAIVGDHGEAFWEHGTFGHGAGLEDEQVRVPFVLCGSHRPSARYEYSSHADLMPTWFDAMGLEGTPRPFMSGRSLLFYRPETDVAVAGLGITGTSLSRRFVAAGHGLKVTFDNAAAFPIVAVSDSEDRPVTTAGGEAATVLSMALGTKLFRSPAGN